MAADGKLWLATNSSSGSFDAALLADVRSALQSGDDPPFDGVDTIIDCQSDPLPDGADLDRAGVSWLAVLAGDGTLSRYLAKLERERWRGAVLPLPGGTQNLLCGAIHGDRNATDIGAMMARGELRKVQRRCLRCEDYTALAEILLGPGAGWAHVREDFRAGKIEGTLDKSLAIIKDAAAGPHVRIAEPAIGRETGYPGLHFSLSTGTMTARGYHMDNPAEWLRQGTAMALRDFREGPYEDLGTLTRALCRPTQGNHIDLMIDGEPEQAIGDVTIVEDEFDLTFLGPPE